MARIIGVCIIVTCIIMTHVVVGDYDGMCYSLIVRFVVGFSIMIVF